MKYNLANKKIFVAGHNGMVGRAVQNRLSHENCDIMTATRSQLDLTNQVDVENWFKKNTPDAIILCAARVGGIHANDLYPAEFIYQNLMIEANVIHAAYQSKVEKLLFLGSSCIYPRDCTQPIKEDYLLSGALESTNEPYAIAKIAGLKLCQAYRKQYGCDFISAMPTNLYGPYDNFHDENAHVPAALLKRMYDAKTNGNRIVTLWGTGTPRREFMHVNDVADAILFLMQNYSDNVPINIGTGRDITINDFAKVIAEIIGYDGKIVNDLSKPDGTPLKRLDVNRINDLGWSSSTELKDGLTDYYQWFLGNQSILRAA